MFRPNSRYAEVLTTEGTASGGRKVTALKLRRLPPTTGAPLMAHDNTQLDVLALDRYSDPTKYWHIADANTELEARHLVDETGEFLQVPEK